MVRFILGGARSGKSAYAESLAKSAELEGYKVFYIATAKRVASSLAVDDGMVASVDTEMLSRIQRHQADRPSHWQTVETPIHLADCLQVLDNDKHCLLIDCLTLWTLNVLEAECLEKEKKALLSRLTSLKSEVILVSNEVGLGVVPLGKLTRCFVDELGWLHQDIAQCADEVFFVTAGLPMKLK